MANRHQKGQIIVETIIVMTVLTTVLLLIIGHMDAMKGNFEKNDLTREPKYGNTKFYRKK
jgi:competence protein ComGC